MIIMFILHLYVLFVYLDMMSGLSLGTVLGSAHLLSSRPPRNIWLCRSVEDADIRRLEI